MMLKRTLHDLTDAYIQYAYDKIASDQNYLKTINDI